MQLSMETAEVQIQSVSHCLIETTGGVSRQFDDVIPRGKMPNFRVVDPSGIANDKPSCLLWLLDVLMVSKTMRRPGRLNMGYYTMCG